MGITRYADQMSQLRLTIKANSFEKPYHQYEDVSPQQNFGEDLEERH
jgi:hypothetical protein